MALLEGSASCVRKFAFRDAAGAVGALLPQETLDQLLQPLHTSYLNNVGFDWNSILCWNLVELQLINLLEDSSPTETLLVQLLNANPAIRRLKLGTTDLIFYESNLPSIKLLELQTLELNMGSQFMSWLSILLVPRLHKLALLVLFSASSIDKAQGANALRSCFARARIDSLAIWRDLGIPFPSITPHLPYLENITVTIPFRGDHRDLSELQTETKRLSKYILSILFGAVSTALIVAWKSSYPLPPMSASCFQASILWIGRACKSRSVFLGWAFLQIWPSYPIRSLTVSLVLFDRTFSYRECVSRSVITLWNGLLGNEKSLCRWLI